MQMGRHAAKNILFLIRGSEPKPFRYFDKGSMATIGRNKAIVDLKGARFGGFFAWLTWLFVHLMFLVGLRNRLSVFFSGSGRTVHLAGAHGSSTGHSARRKSRLRERTSLLGPLRRNFPGPWVHPPISRRKMPWSSRHDDHEWSSRQCLEQAQSAYYDSERPG
jgi:hypothetical protein